MNKISVLQPARTLSDNWLFHLGDLPDSWMKDADESAFTPVFVPHDWSLSLPFSKEYSSGTGYAAGGIGWYRCHFALPEEWRKQLQQGLRVYVRFDAVYKRADFYLNGYHLGYHANGYTPVTFDLTDYLKLSAGTGSALPAAAPGTSAVADVSDAACAAGEAASVAAFRAVEGNVLCVRVNHPDLADSRWFTGSGITRKVTLFAKPPVATTEYGVFFHTVSIDPADGSARIQVQTELQNTTPAPAAVRLTHSLTAPDGSQAALMTQTLDIAAGSRIQSVLDATVFAAQLWSPDAPALYRLDTTLEADTADDAGNAVTWSASDSSRVGIRTIRFDADTGFTLNGISHKLRGVCVHDDCGPLGCAAVKQAWYPRLALLKEGGCNAIRMAHNPHMPELYDLCDEMGFLVMDEAFDEWEGSKNKWSTGHNVYPPRHEGYWMDFPMYHEQDLADMVLSHRNHPCIILWSIGNEIDYPNDPYCHPFFKEMVGNNDSGKPAAEMMYNPNRPNAERMAALAAMLADEVRAVDTTRPVTLAAAFPELSSRLGFFDHLDVVGYNYKEHLYEESHQRFPDLPFLGSENSPRYEDWKAVRDNDYISGQFLWTGVDYLGEAHGWPIRSSSAGLLDTAAYPKAKYYQHMSYWSDTPMAHLACALAADHSPEWFRPVEENWNYMPGEEIEVSCYTNLSQAELFLNGASLGKKEREDDEDAIRWIVPFAEGRLTVKASGRLTSYPDGRPEVTAQDLDAAYGEAEAALETVGAPARLRLTPVEIPAAYYQPDTDIEQFVVDVLDPRGRLVSLGDCPVHVEVNGGKLLGIDNGDVADCTPYYCPVRRTHRGHLRIYVRRSDPGQKIRVAVTSGVLTPASAEC